MTDGNSVCKLQILRMRMSFALRRATGVVFDVEAMLSRPHLRSRRLAMWRAVGSDELNSLIDLYETQIPDEVEAEEPAGKA